MPCEDAPCCGCCGTNLYGVRQDGCTEEEFADQCASCIHVSPEDCEATPCTAGFISGPVYFGTKEEVDERIRHVVVFCTRCRMWHASPMCGTFSEEALEDEEVNPRGI